MGESEDPTTILCNRSTVAIPRTHNGFYALGADPNGLLRRWISCRRHGRPRQAVLRTPRRTHCCGRVEGVGVPALQGDHTQVRDTPSQERAAKVMLAFARI